MSSSASAQDNEIGFIERFALADDRAEALKELIPGTEEYYFFHSLHFQNTGQKDELAKMLEQWKKRFERSQLRSEINNREALLNYESDPESTIEYLKRELGLVFNHQRERQQTNPDIPTTLDQSMIALEEIVKRSLKNERNLGEVSAAGIDWLMLNWGETELSVPQKRELLGKLTRPDYPSLVEALLEDLDRKESRGFGEFNVHGMLLLPQLDALAQARPELLKNQQFVLTKLGKLRPGADTDLTTDRDALRAYLDRAWDFVAGLEPAFHSLKAHILFQQLSLDQSRGEYSEERFLTYLRLPRPVANVNPRFRDQVELWRYPVDLNFDASSATGFPPIRYDEELVCDYLLQLLAGRENSDAFAPYISSDYLKATLAEANIVSGHGDVEQWASLLTPSAYQELKNRVDLDFDPTCRESFSDDETVKFDLHVKNVQSLIVKVYEVNTFNYFQNFGQQINTDLNLDGLVANEELSFDFAADPFVRTKRSFEFPQLKAERGVWVIEFIGNGKSSRALVRRGGLQYITRNSSAGNVLRVLDQKRQNVSGAYAWLNGKRYDQDEDGEITIPFSNQPGQKKIILADGEGFAALENFSLQGESYALRSGFYIDREELLATHDATLAVRPNFTLNGAAGDVELLEDVVLTIVSTDLDGVQSTATVPGFKLYPHKESTHTLRVPERLASLQFLLTAKVRNVSKGKDETLTASNSVSINQIAVTDAVTDLFLSKADGVYQVQALGRTGEAKKNIALNLNLRRDDFRTDVRLTLRTDETGTIHLGALDGIYRVRATAPNGMDHRWVLPKDRIRYPSTIHAKAGDEISLPVLNDSNGGDSFSLLERANGVYVRDFSSKISVKNSIASIRGLPAGDYRFVLKESDSEVTIRITEGELKSGFLLSDSRNLELNNPKPLLIEPLNVEGDSLVIRMANATPRTRLHIFSSKFVPAFDAFDALGSGAALQPLMGTPSQLRNLFVSGRSIGDEYRYIIDRRYAKKYPGNMLKRPGLLLNPWALRDTATANDKAEAGQDWERSNDAKTSSLRRKGIDPGAGVKGQSDSHSLDFLAEPAGVSFNVAPGEDGVVRVKLNELGDRQYVRVIAVDSATAVERSITLPAEKTAFKDLRLANGLNPKRHFTQQDQISILEPRKAFVIEDISTATFEAYETIGGVYQLLMTLSGRNATLAEFSFITEWPDHEDDRKRELYSKYACHELSFFIQRKDPEFFKSTVLPYLSNKKDKTFIDHYLLGSDLKPYLQSWKFAQLNVVERILLAGRLPEERSSIARDIEEWLATLPPELRLDLQNFDAGLAGSSLSFFDDSLDGVSLGRKLQAVRKAQKRSAVVDFDGEELAELQAEMAPAAVAAPMPTAGRSAAKRKERLVEEEALLQRGRRAVSNRRLSEVEAEEMADSQSVESFGLIPAEEMRKDRLSRAQLRQFFRKLEKTREWAENNYYHLPIEQQNQELITVNKFWNDFASRDPEKPFYSKHISEASRNFSEMMIALAVTDLPFKATADENGTMIDGNKLTLTPTAPVILFHKEIREAAAARQSAQLLVSQNFFRQDDRYVESNGERRDRFVTDEFLTGVGYGCQVVVTNPTSSVQRLELMQQIPVGAIAVSKSKATANTSLRLEPYQTHTQEYFFYFPAAGTFPHFPVHVSKDQEIVAFADPFSFKVVDELSNVDTSSWAYVSQWGTSEQVVDYLATNNLRQTDLRKVAWRCREDADFFKKVIDILIERHHYDATLFSYGVYHNVLQPMQQYLLHADSFLVKCGAALEAPLVTIDPVERKSYQHLEYSPLVNARWYSVGGVQKILNDRFRVQYRELMRIFSYRQALDAHDYMTLTYYLLLQDRVEEALNAFAKVEREVLSTQLQYDYFQAYTAFYLEDTATARAVATRYADYPVDRWQKVFREVAAQLDEIDGGATQLVDQDDREQQQEKLASAEPGFTFKIEDRKVKVLYRNLTGLTVNYYRMDLEFLFSTNPFVSSDSSRFSIIKPNRTDQLDLDATGESAAFDLAEEFEGQNVLVELIGAGIRKSETYYSNTLDVQIARNYGQLRVAAEGEDSKPVPRAYVKVYAEIDGEPRFYKDGYTDLRGKFDYVSLSTNEIDNVTRFSILVMSPENGALVAEVKPPQR